MKLVKLAICNYRSFGERVEILIDDITTFIGNNSAGKTSALSALNCIFSPFSRDRFLTKKDFHVASSDDINIIDELSLYIEAYILFDELDNGDSESLKNHPQVAIFENYLTGPDANGKLYLRVRLEAKWQKDLTIDGNISSNVFYVKSLEEPFDESLKIIAKYVELSKIRSLYIPAIREPSLLLKNASGNILGQILGCMNWSETKKCQIENGVKKLNDLFNQEEGIKWIAESIQEQWKIYNSDYRYKKASFSLNNINIESVMKSAGVVFSSSVDECYDVDKLGDGLRSLFYISLIDGLLQVEEKIQRNNVSEQEEESRVFKNTPPFLTIIALEEPENHIAPHLLGKLMSNLKKIALRINAQVIVSSHSPSIVKRVDPDNIRFFKICESTQCTSVKKIKFPSKESCAEQYKFVKEAVTAYPEIYFSRLVILGEGDSEELILSKYWNAKYKTLDENGASLVPLGGRFVNHFWRLLEDLEIPYVTLLDLDRERGQGGWVRIKYALDQLVEKGKIQLSDIKDENGNEIDLKLMLSWDDDENKYKYWIEKLEDYDVFFSAPLDIDFLMLKKFPDIYKSIINEEYGPRVSYLKPDGKTHDHYTKVCDEEKRNPLSNEYIERMKKGIAATLKAEGKSGDTYDVEEQKLMIWYDYLFLSNGKPSTHLLAIKRIEDNHLLGDIPEVLDRLLAKAASKLVR